MDEIEIGGIRITVIEGDLTTQEVAAVVDPANEYLVAGGGLSAAIVRAGGETIQQESHAWVAAHGPLSPGVAAVTGAGTLAARYVIHVAGPVHREGQNNAGLLATAVAAALDAAAAEECPTVAMPAISAGVFGYPLAAATAVIARSAADWARRHPRALDEIRLIGYDTAAADAFRAGVAAVADA